MTRSYRTPARRRAERRTGRKIGVALLVAVAGLVIFALGIGLGRAIEENPEPGGTITQVRTLRPLPLAPERETVTVTVTTTAR
jgi:hypothetical protein